MSHHVRNLAPYLFVIASFALPTALNAAQDAEAPTTKPAESEKQTQTAEKPVETPLSAESNNKADGIVSEWSAWAKAPVSDSLSARIPAVTDPFPSAEEAKANLDIAIRSAFRDHLNQKLQDFQLAHQLTPDAFTLKSKFARDNLWEVLKSEVDEVPSFRAATRLDIPHYELEVLLSDYLHKRAQLAAVQQTAFVGVGLIAFVGILAFQAKLNHATNGKRSGILRAASAIAILSLLGGFITAAALSGIFNA